MIVQTDPNAQINRFTETLLQYLMEQNLMKQRQKGQMQYLNRQQEGYETLESQRYGNDFNLLIEKYNQELDKMPGFERLSAEIQLGIRSGSDVSKLIKKREEMAQDYTETALAGLMPGQQIDPAKLKTIVQMLPQVATTQFLNNLYNITGGRERIALEEKKLEAGETKLREYQIPSLEARKAGKAKGTGADPYAKFWQGKVSDVRSYLTKLIGSNDPLAQEEGGVNIISSYLAAISEIETRASKGQLSREEEAFVDNAYKTIGQGLGAPGGLDQYGFFVGQRREDVSGTTWIYMGQNTWQTVQPAPKKR